MSSPYRDSLEVLRNRLRALDEEIRDLEGRYTELFWDEVAPRVRLEGPVAFEAVGDQAEMDELTGAIQLREARLAELHRVEREYPEIERVWSEPEAAVPECAPSRHLDIQGSLNRAILGDPNLPAYEKAVNSLDVDPGATLKSASKSFRTFDFSVGGVPFSSRCETYMSNKTSDWQIDLTVQTTVPRLHGELQLSPQGFGSELLIALRLKQDIKIGHSAFDGNFVIKGDPQTAEAVLTTSVRTNLMLIAGKDIPIVVVSRGLASIQWHFEPDRRCLRAAIDALIGIRHAEPTRALKKVS